MRFTTRAIHAGQEPDPPTGAVMVPVCMTSIHAQQKPWNHQGYEYSRTGNPTWNTLEEGQRGLCFAGGLGATDSVIKRLKSVRVAKAGNPIRRPLLSAAVLLYVFSLIAPFLRVEPNNLDVSLLRLAAPPAADVTIVGSVTSLVRSGDYMVAGILFAFLILAPVVKFAILAGCVFRRDRKPSRIAGAYGYLQPWSMCHVFVTATFLLLLKAMPFCVILKPNAGLYAALFSLALEFIVILIVRPAEPENHVSPSSTIGGSKTGRLFLKLMSLVAAVTLLWSLLVPLFTLRPGISIAVFDELRSSPLISSFVPILADQPYTMLSSIAHLYNSGDKILAAIMLLFSVAFPIGKVSLLLASQSLSGHIAKLPVRTLHRMGPWSMLDVFIVAMLFVVMQKMPAHETLVVDNGFYLFCISVLLSMIVSVLISPPFHISRESTFHSEAIAP